MADQLAAAVFAHWPAFALAAYLGIGFWFAQREVLACIREHRRTGERSPLWPVWVLVTCLWPMFAAQGFVFAALVLWDAAAARRADKREARVRLLPAPARKGAPHE